MVPFRWSLVLLAVVTLCAATEAQAQRSAAAGPAPRQAGPGDAAGAPEMKIAAVVNDEVISVFDLISRMRMVMLASNIPDTPELRQRIGPQILRGLIDEKLELQEARRQNVTASDSEISNALQKLAKQNNMEAEQLSAFLKARGIDRGTLVDQITATLVWGKLVRRQAAQSIEISDEEIDEALKRARENAKEPQSRLAEIFLAVDNPAQDEEVRRFAERLSQQMRQGARFSAVARQFSKAATAAVGGDMGWVRSDQLAPELARAMAQLRPGELSAPIPFGGGYYLLLVLERRAGGGTAREQETVYDIVQVAFPVSQGASEAARRAAIAEAEAVRAAAKDCPTLLSIGKAKAPQLSSQGQVQESRIAPEMRSVIGGLPIGETSQPIVQKNGVGVIMVCSKSSSGDAGAREAVTDSLIRQRLDTVSRRYLRDLRRNSYVDVRV